MQDEYEQERYTVITGGAGMTLQNSITEHFVFLKCFCLN